MKIKENEILSSYNFARNCDFVFSEDLSKDQFNKLKNINSLKIVSLSNERVVYINKLISIRDNDLVFCKTEHVKLLFRELKNLKVKNLTLITNQSDIPINKKLFDSKPASISNWLAINVAYENKNLIPIPLGISNYYEKNINASEIINNFDTSFNKRIDDIYINFNISTNYKAREKYYLDNQYNSFYIQEPNLNKNDLISDLKKFKYTLCPEGNGIDTHRIYEALYLGSIPIVKKNFLSKELKKLPIIYLDDLNFNNLISAKGYAFTQ